AREPRGPLGHRQRYDGWYQAIPPAAQHFEVTRLLRIVAERIAQQLAALDDGLGTHDAPVPDRGGERIVAHYVRCGLDQRQQEPVAQRAEVDGSPAARELLAAGIQHQVLDL